MPTKEVRRGYTTASLRLHAPTPCPKIGVSTMFLIRKFSTFNKKSDVHIPLRLVPRLHILQ